MAKKGKKSESEKRPQSPELAGGSGFTFEDAVAASYLAALLAEAYAPGMPDHIVVRVAVQQRHFKQPLDDVIVDFRNASGGTARLGLQVKRALTISAAKSNTDFRDVIRDSWTTYRDPAFRPGIDRYGAAVGDIAKTRARDLTYLCELARASTTVDHFKARFAKGGNASAAVKAIKRDISALLKKAKGSACSDEEIHRFLANFVLVQFDFLHDGASTSPAAMTLLRECLQPTSAGDAPLLWSRLRTIARDSAGKSGEFDRPRLVRELAAVVRLRTAASLRLDLDKLTALTRDYAADIQNDVGGTHIDRGTLAAELERAISASRFVQVRGLPGSGKSVLLRRRIDVELARGGPVLFLKSDRLAGKGWSGFAAGNGLSGAPLETLLAEIAATGSSTLYIDGIDRIEKEHQAIVLDVLRAILRSPTLSNWKIVVSLRDTGLEPLRNWLADILNTLPISTIKVDALDEDEADLLAKAKPALRPLLFGPAQVRDIVRRPFFAKVLYQSFAVQSSGPPFEPRSEVDLIENWWLRGGYDSAGQDAIARQRALIDIGAQRARQLSQPVPLATLAPASVQVIDKMVNDGLLQHVKNGISVRFSHDIFFEWSFFYVLSERGDHWLDELRACGEPPAVARVVELLSQFEYKAGTTWVATLQKTAVAKMRSQWTRAWLLGPLGNPFIEQDDTQFANTVAAKDFQLLNKALVWFQAEKTTPNTNILAQDLPTDQRIRFADYYAWPSDLPMWRRLITVVLARVDTIPVSLYPDIVSVFEVWQNIARDIKNPVSRAILTQCAKWLREIDTRSARDTPPPPSRWDGMKEVGNLRHSLSDLILAAARVMPELAEEYLKRLIAGERLREERFKEVLLFSPTLASTHPQLLADFTLKGLKRELPDDRVRRERAEMRRNAEARERIRAKPEHERTRQEQMFLSGGFMHFGHSFSYHDWNHLSLDDSSQIFWPPSPLREPFHSLFKTSPPHAISLFNALCNHAITAWRQLHRHIHDSPGTPIPLEIQLPRGVQQFWGGDREYLWHRRAPKAITSGFMALEDWCFAELERGRPVDELIRQIVEGNQCIGILAIASLLALHTDRVSETVFSIIRTQRLWFADWNRMGQSLSDGNASLIGFKPHEMPHLEAVRTTNARAARKKTLRWLAQRYVLDQTFGERTRAAILAFKDDLPYQIEEHRMIQAAQDHLMKQALEYAELAVLENYRARRANKDGDIEVFHVSPSASKPENVAKVEKATLSLQEGHLWAWAQKAFDEGKVDDEAKFPDAIDLAKKLDSTRLFKNDKEEDVGVRRGAVAATAAMVLHFRNGRKAAELKWARRILLRAITVQDRPDTFWSPQSVIPWHQGIFVARGLAADIRHGTGHADTPLLLLALVAHPLEAVSLAALSESASLWDKDAKLVWAALTMALSLCHLDPLPPHEPRGPGEPLHTNEGLKRALDAAVKYYLEGEGWPALPLPPPAWIKADQEPGDPYQEPDVEFHEDDVAQPAERWIEPKTHWYDQYAAKILERIPYSKICASEAKEPLLAFATDVLTWTNAKNAPQWLKKGRRDRESSRLFEWTHQLGTTLGHIAGLLPVEDFKTRFLQPIFELEGDTCWALLAPLVSSYICAYIYDAKTMPERAVDVVQLCLQRFLESSTLKNRNSYRAGEFSGFDEPGLARSLMFVEVERAMLAARFVNGDWNEIEVILPIVDRFVRAAGWAVSVMGHFLTLCERAKGAYPAEMFADQILAVIGDGTEPLPGWHGTFIHARIAGLVQFLADRDTPMPLTLGQKLLRILDLLVDMGDRRSAALQLSEAFREIKIA